MAGQAVTTARGHRGTGALVRLARATVPLCLGALLACGAPGPETPKAHVYIPRGASLSAVADSLVSHGVIGTAWTFRTYARLRGLSRRVRPGLYAFPLGERWSVIVGALATGRTDDALFTVPEGLSIREIATLAANQLRLAQDSVNGAVRDSFLAAARDPAMRLEFNLDIPSTVKEPLEGYLLPESYRVAYDETARDLVRHMIRQHLNVWDTAAERRRQALGLSRHQVVTLASIVEAEAHHPDEQRTIAGVYLNRLRKRMPLQADPTVVYAMQLDMDKPPHVFRVLYRHLKTPSPYNTYYRPGLPPGPIAAPGRGAILATLDPERHNFLYFVARPDYYHMFSETARQHGDSVAVARVLRDRFEAQRDSIRRDSIAQARAARATRAPAGTR